MVALQKDIGPRVLWYVKQIKHYLDIDRYPLWKRLFFYKVYRPFVLFVYHVLKLPVLMKIDADGKPCWEERQCFCTSEERAEELTRGKKWWSYNPVYEDVCLPVETSVIGKQVETGNGDRHERKEWPLWATKQTDKYMQNAVLHEARTLIERLEQRHL